MTLPERREALLALAERCEKATGPDRKVDAAICRLLDLPKCFEPDCLPDVFERIIDRVERGEWDQDPEVPFYTASLDAAMTLVPQGWGFAIGEYFNPKRAPFARTFPPDYANSPIEAQWSDNCSTPALALCAAALKARSQTPSGGGSCPPLPDETKPAG